jgi:hypothetical protein
MAPERVLVNFFYAHPVGHAIEALHYCLGHHAADPTREIAVALSARTPVSLARYCPFVTHAYAVDHPFLEPGTRPLPMPREWDWVLDDPRRRHELQFELFPGLRDYYAASDAHLVARRGRTIAGADPPGYRPHQQLRLELPRQASLGDGPWIALMPGGSSERALYPSVASWRLIMDALADARFALVGRLGRDQRTSTSFTAAEHAALLAHPSRPLDAFDRPLEEQLAIVEACDVFLAPHTGFGMAALAVGTPWLALSGGRWFEWFFNRVPFRSIVPDTARYPSYSQFDPLALTDDDGPRTPSMTRARIEEDLDAIVAAAHELIAGTLPYEQALRDYFADLLRAHHGDPSALWSHDGVHAEYVYG